MSDSLQFHGPYSPWKSPGCITGVGSLWLLWGNLPNPVIEPRSPTLQVDSLPAEPQGKPFVSEVACFTTLEGKLLLAIQLLDFKYLFNDKKKVKLKLLSRV